MIRPGSELIEKELRQRAMEYRIYEVLLVYLRHFLKQVFLYMKLSGLSSNASSVVLEFMISRISLSLQAFSSQWSHFLPQASGSGIGSVRAYPA